MNSKLQRVLEPEVMDTLKEAVDYDSMDHSVVNARFADDFLAVIPNDAVSSERSLKTLDVGTGTAQIPIELVRRILNAHITAIDLSQNMLDLGRKNVERAGLVAQIDLQLVDAKGLPFADGSFDAVVSNSIIHHIPEPLACFREMLRVLRPGGILFVRDLLRPIDLPTLRLLVDQYAKDCNPHQRQLFSDSLHAALSISELHALAEQLGIPSATIRQTTDRHWTCVFQPG